MEEHNRLKRGLLADLQGSDIGDSTQESYEFARWPASKNRLMIKFMRM